MEIHFEQVLEYWFTTLSPSQWWTTDQEIDRQIAEKFTKLHQQAALGELYHWRETTRGRLAEILILDQFSRNLFRNSGQAFAYDGMALVLAQEFVRHHGNKELTAKECSFAYMPYMHSESAKVQQQSIAIFAENGIASNVKFAKEHKDIIDRFNRYPHRNEVLGRQSTPEEKQFLQQHPGF